MHDDKFESRSGVSGRVGAPIHQLEGDTRARRGARRILHTASRAAARSVSLGGCRQPNGRAEFREGSRQRPECPCPGSLPILICKYEKLFVVVAVGFHSVERGRGHWTGVGRVCSSSAGKVRRIRLRLDSDRCVSSKGAVWSSRCRPPITILFVV